MTRKRKRRLEHSLPVRVSEGAEEDEAQDSARAAGRGGQQVGVCQGHPLPGRGAAQGDFTRHVEPTARRAQGTKGRRVAGEAVVAEVAHRAPRVQEQVERTNA